MATRSEFGRRHAEVTRLVDRRAPRRRFRVPFVAIAIGFAAAGAVATLAVDAIVPRLGVPPSLGAPAPTHSAHFGLCGSGPRITCVVDGDTIWFEGVKIRIADIDTPEVSQPRCGAERMRGQDATRRLVALLNEGPFEIVADGGRDTDRYGRKLRVVRRDGVSLGEALVAEGLAVRWGSGRPDWC